MAIVAVDPGGSLDRGRGHEFGGAEAVIQTNSRPALIVRNGTFESPIGPRWRDACESARDGLEYAIPAVGRVESDDPTLPFIGTAFLVAENLVMTTRHLASTFVNGVGRENDLSIAKDRQIRVNFLAELGSDVTLTCAVISAKFVHPYFDVAVLEIESPKHPVRPLELETQRPPLIERKIAVVGYPAQDARNPTNVMNRLFEGIFGKKRLMPGLARDVEKFHSFHNAVPTLTHDATTSGGTAGAPVIDFESGHVIGIQFAGRYLVANYAVPTWELARDPYVLDSGIRFTEDPRAPWMSLWDSGEQTTGRMELAAEAVSEPDAGAVEGSSGIFDVDTIKAIHELLLKLGMATPSKLRTLFSMMPPEFVANLATGDTPADTLFCRLTDINRFGKIFFEHTPFYVLLTSAITLASIRPGKIQLEEFRDRVLRTEEGLGADR